MAFSWSTDNMNEFYEMTQFAHKPYYNPLHFQFSPTGLTLTVWRPSPEGRCFIELECQPPFFFSYTINADQTLHCAVSSQQFFSTFLQMKQSGYDSMIFCIPHQLPTLELSFYKLSVPQHLASCDRHLPFLSTHQDLDHHRTVSTTLLIFRASTFQSLLAIFNQDHVTLTVTLTTSQAMFTGRVLGTNVRFIYSVQGGDCEIRGVAQGEETRFVILLNPIGAFNDILSRSDPTNSVVISKSINTNRGIISIPTRLYTQYVSYSSDQ